MQPSPTVEIIAEKNHADAEACTVTTIRSQATDQGAAVPAPRWAWTAATASC
jgi:hypothetical protein